MTDLEKAEIEFLDSQKSILQNEFFTFLSVNEKEVNLSNYDKFSGKNLLCSTYWEALNYLFRVCGEPFGDSRRLLKELSTTSFLHLYSLTLTDRQFLCLLNLTTWGRLARLKTLFMYTEYRRIILPYSLQEDLEYGLGKHFFSRIKANSQTPHLLKVQFPTTSSPHYQFILSNEGSDFPADFKVPADFLVFMIWIHCGNHHNSGPDLLELELTHPGWFEPYAITAKKLLGWEQNSSDFFEFCDLLKPLVEKFFGYNSSVSGIFNDRSPNFEKKFYSEDPV